MDILKFEGLSTAIIKQDDKTAELSGVCIPYDTLIESHNIIFDKGCFTNFLQSQREAKIPRTIPILRDHNHFNQIGIVTELLDGKTELRHVHKLVKDVPEAAIVLALIEADALRTMSIGIHNIEGDYDNDQVYHITSCDLNEISYTPLPASIQARVDEFSLSILSKDGVSPKILEKFMRDVLNFTKAQSKEQVAVFKKRDADRMQTIRTLETLDQSIQKLKELHNGN